MTTKEKIGETEFGKEMSKSELSGKNMGKTKFAEKMGKEDFKNASIKYSASM